MTHPEDTATIERDLGAIEAALADGTATYDEPPARALQELALALQADAPAPDPQFARELEGRVRSGFPRLGHGRSVRPSLLRRIPLAPVAAVVAPLLLIVIVVFAASGPSDDAGDSGGGGGASVAESGGGGVAESGGGGDGAQSTLDTPAQARDAARPRDGFAPNRTVRRVERSITMTLAAPDDEIPEVADGVARVTARNGGFVLRSELNTNEGGGAGFFELRIPNEGLQTALRGLAGFATVQSQSQSDRDITRGFIGARDRLLVARAERRGLLRRLERAVTDAETDALQARLDLVATRINGLTGRLRGLRLRTDYATVTVDLASTETDTGAGVFGDAVADAEDLLVGFAGVLIRVLAIAVSLGLIALAGWVTGAALRRRRRESALA